MIAYTALPLFGLLLFGILLRILASRFEARHLHFAWDFLCRPGEQEDKELRTVVIDRTFIALSAAKLGRLISILVLAPSIYLLANMLLPRLDLSGTLLSSHASEILRLFLMAVIIAMLFLSLSSLFMKGFYAQRRASTHSDAPKWLVNPAEDVPAPIAAGSLMWDWLVRSGELLYRQFNLVRPRAYLFEQDDELLMAVGDVEMQAVGENKAVAPKAATADERTEQEMIRSIQRLDETLVREVMRPLNNVTAIGLTNLTTEKFLAIARRTGYTRFPCYYDQVTNLIGFLNVYDFLDNKVDTSDPAKLVRRVTFTPEIARVDLALREMLRTKSQVEICFDEFGGCSGLLSREDIIEEITGEIMDEYDRPETKIQTAHGQHLVNGSIDLDDLGEALGLQLEKKNCDTLAGYIYQRLSRIPRRGEGFEEHGWKIEVLQLDNHRIRRVRLTPPAADQDEAPSHSEGA
ncbi:hypothetical protein IT570_00625 [Candidatus Sumerlaeota bacterium]|nr:hypothetical protein [Candidatus Sumerlaeota bacterium]